VDADENQEPAGAESQFYQSQRPPYRAANAPLVGFGDLRLVKGFTPEIVDRLSHYVTLFPVDGGALVNLNTADLLVIQALDPAITQTVASEIAQGRPYKKKEDLDRIGSFQEIGAKLRATQSGYDVKSEYFSARLAISVNDVTKIAWVVLRRDANKGESTVQYLKMF
jgi:general secretion pathway protein K